MLHFYVTEYKDSPKKKWDAISQCMNNKQLSNGRKYTASSCRNRYRITQNRKVVQQRNLKFPKNMSVYARMTVGQPFSSFCFEERVINFSDLESGPDDSNSEDEHSEDGHSEDEHGEDEHSEDGKTADEDYNTFEDMIVDNTTFIQCILDWDDNKNTPIDFDSKLNLIDLDQTTETQEDATILYQSSSI